MTAFASVEGEVVEDWSLTIFGEGPYRRELERQVQNLGLEQKVRYPGQVADPSGVLGDFDCFVFPSWYEGFSGALVEAMLAGMPIIASDIPMNLEAVTHLQTALIFDVHNPGHLAEQLRFALANREVMQGLGVAAHASAVERFEIGKIANQYERTLHAICP